ncbi:hypothetical protein BVRB_6g155880 [Beta vulgaris subsp. vulgaris]|uniref:Uncharacterized protein n=1 Tax=Beta vulgaris subsp. vulgaris TaxID=3555 RepID=A0A0J8BBF5_BETVV|nr:hypothetical protein BVRB_6g155880 [Beta vulgaris subsp. vulgaris]
MSDLSDSQNVSVEAFLTESDPSSPSVGLNSEPENSPVGRTRLLADIPPTTDRERELRSKFLNDPSTPEEQNLTLRYLTASQSGDKQTLRELRHQILARRTRRHPPADAVPGLDVPPLREHAWLDSLADAGVRVPSNYDRLQESVTPNPPIIDLGDDSDSPHSMARGDDKEATYQRRADASASKAPMVEEVSRTEEESETGPGTGALWLPEDDCLDHLDLDALGVDSEHRPLTHLPAPPSSDYLTMHSSTNGRRGGNRHGPQNLRRRGRGASTSVRVPIAAATSNAPPSPAVPLRSSATRTVNRGAINRSRTREPTVDDSAANKRQATEEPGASAANEVVQVEDLDPNTSEGNQGEGGLDAGLGNAGGTSLLSRSTSSLREKQRELIATPSFLSNLFPGIFYRFREWIEKKEVPLSDAVAAAFAPQTVTPGKANNAAIELIEQYLEYQRLTDTYKASLETCQGLLKEAEEKVAPLEDEVQTLRDRAALLEETEENVKALTKAVETANSEKEMAVLDASAAEARGAAKAVAEFKGSDDYNAEKVPDEA